MWNMYVFSYSFEVSYQNNWICDSVMNFQTLNPSMGGPLMPFFSFFLLGFVTLAIWISSFDGALQVLFCHYFQETFESISTYIIAKCFILEACEC